MMPTLSEVEQKKRASILDYGSCVVLTILLIALSAVALVECAPLFLEIFATFPNSDLFLVMKLFAGMFFYVMALFATCKIVMHVNEFVRVRWAPEWRIEYTQNLIRVVGPIRWAEIEFIKSRISRSWPDYKVLSQDASLRQYDADIAAVRK